jgi:hypothetical protein
LIYSEKFAAILELEPNWDGNGAPAIDEACIKKAIEAWDAMRDLHLDVFPRPDGGVRLSSANGTIEITIANQRVARAREQR